MKNYLLVPKYLFYTVKRKAASAGKAFVTLLMLSGSVLNCLAQQDLPLPPSNLQTIPAGNFIVPMDNIYQSLVPAGQAPFNIKAYGIINEFLQNGIPVKWAIRSGKQLDDIDITAMVERIAPGVMPAATLSFRSGPFIVPDTVLPCGLSTREIINAFGSNVAVYKLSQNIVADIRYTLTHRPKIAVFNNGGNQIIHTRILDAAGIEEYEVMDAADIANLINCYTFASEPHAENQNISTEVINGIKAFVTNGGNFLAQCHAIDAYENQGYFMTTSGILTVNTNVSHHYPNADLAFSQMNGPLKENEGGSVHNFTLQNGSSWRPYVYRSVSNLETDTVVALGAHLIAPASPGGNVFYLGGHDYSKGKNQADLSTLARVNALRMYLNCIFIPSGRSNGAWANAGLPSLLAGCGDGVVLGCSPTGPPGSAFLWTPSEGLSCTACPNPVAHPKVSTTYKVVVTNGCTATDSVRVEVGLPPAAAFTANTVCQGAYTTFESQSAGAVYWRWDFGDPASGASNTSSLSAPTHLFSHSGTFEVSLIAGTSATCADTIKKTVTVDPVPLLTVNSMEICKGQQATLTVTGADSYSWSGGDKGSSITVMPDETTHYSITGTLGNCLADTTVTVTVVPPLLQEISVTDVTCEGGSNGTASIVVSGGKPGYTYTWNTVPEQTSSRAANLSAGAYTVTVRDAAGCSVSAEANVRALHPLPVIHSSVEGEGCEPFCIAFNNYNIETTDPIREWSWDFGDPSSPENSSSAPYPSHCYGKAGTYTVMLKVTTGNGCSASAASENSIRVHPVPPLELGDNKTICLEDERNSQIGLSAGPGKNYLWQPTGDTTQSILVKSPGTYKVTVTNGLGCSSSDEVRICESCEPRIFLSNAFSPNLPPDGINDTYLVHGKYDSDFRMLIFNRWGEIIFESTDRTVSWDGYYRGEPMPTGVYPWIITYKGSCGDDKVRRMEGSVTIVR